MAEAEAKAMLRPTSAGWTPTSQPTRCRPIMVTVVATAAVMATALRSAWPRSTVSNSSRTGSSSTITAVA